MAKKKKEISDDEAPKKKAVRKKKVVDGAEKTDKKAPKAKRKARAKKVAEIARMRIFWGVFNHALKQVALFEFNQRKAAEKRAEELSEGGKPPHFVQKVKKEIDDKLATVE